jgi:hypothetical protein
MVLIIVHKYFIISQLQIPVCRIPLNSQCPAYLVTNDSLTIVLTMAN